jgi:hypothetical protein
MSASLEVKGKTKMESLKPKGPQDHSSRLIEPLLKA